VALSAASQERTEEHYEPSKTALRSEHKVEESAGAEDPGVAGVPGAQTNLPDALPEGADVAEPRAAAGGGALRRSHTRNWEVDRVTHKTTTPPGGIERLSVAVLLNGRWVDKGGQKVFSPRTEQEVDALSNLVKTAVGFNPERGDAIEVKAMKFAELSGAELVEPKESLVRTWLPHLQLGAGGLLMLSRVVLGWRIGSSAARAAGLRGELARSAEGVDSPLVKGTGIATPALPPGVTSAQLRSHATDLAAKDPATAAVVLRKWLNAPAA
jgi:flagellar M-ring protein FliF